MASTQHTHGPSIGEVHENSATIWYRSDQDLAPVISYWETRLSKDEASAIAIQVDPQADYTSLTKLNNLAPDTNYTFEVGSLQGSFKTPGSSSCSFVFGSCVGGQGYGRNAPGHEDGEGFPIFKRIQEAKPDFFLFNGDTIYADDVIKSQSVNPWNKGDKFYTPNGVSEMPACKDLKSLRDRYKYHLEDPTLAKLLRHVPVYASWDDHEVLDNFGQEILRKQGLGQLFDDGRQAFLEYWPIQRTKEDPNRMYRSFSWGPHVEVFLLDSRSHRDVHEQRGDNKTPTMRYILGDVQLQWLLDGLASSKSTWKFVASSIPLSFPTGYPTPEVDGYDGWSDGKWDHIGGPEAELLKVFEHIRDKSVENVVFLSGDVHFPFALSYDPFHSGGPLFHEVAATPFHALCLPPPESGPDNTFNPTVLYQEGSFGSKNFNFGQVNIASDGRFTFHIRDREGVSLFTLKLAPAAMTMTKRNSLSGVKRKSIEFSAEVNQATARAG